MPPYGLRMDEDVSVLVKQINALNPRVISELVLSDCVICEPGELCAQISRCERLRRLSCVGCVLQPGKLLKLMLEELRYLQRLELSLVQDFDWAIDSEINSMRALALQRWDLIRYDSLRRLYVEVGGDRNFDLLWELLVFCPNLTELHIHFVRGCSANALEQCSRLHDQLEKLEVFTLTSERPAYVPSLYGTCTMVDVPELRGCLWQRPSRQATPVVELRRTRTHRTRARTNRSFFRHSWSCLSPVTKCRGSPSGRRASGTTGLAYVNCACCFYRGQPHHRAERQLISLSPRCRPDGAFPGYPAGEPPAGTLSATVLVSEAGLCADAAIVLPQTEGDLDVRFVTRGPLRCASCVRLANTLSLQEPSKVTTYSSTSNNVTRITLHGVPYAVLLSYFRYCGAATTLRLALWRWERPQYDRLFVLLGKFTAVRCLLLQHGNLPIDDQHFLASLSRMTNLQHLCLLTCVTAWDTVASQCAHDFITRSTRLKCVHMHYTNRHDGLERRLTWLNRGHGEVLLRAGSCFSCCSTATFIGLVKPVNRDCEADL
ncbi:hypothetical protein MRX96_039358 [Rhipicephalus microplus]